MLVKRSLVAATTLLLPLLVVTQDDTATASCGAPPFAITVGNCELSNGLKSWGSSFQIGNPVQRVCLVPSTVINATMVNIREPLCTLSNFNIANQCESIRGGFFKPDESDTWTPTDLRNSNISTSEPTFEHFNKNGTWDVVGYDTVRIRGTTDFALYGAGIALNDKGNQSNAGMIGLGIDSVFLEDVVHQNRSPSKSWGLDAGSRSVENFREGELVIGGYNDGRVGGEFFEEKISDMSGSRPCPLRVKIEQLAIVSPDGNNETNLINEAVSISACIEPYDNSFRWTSDMINSWKAVTGFNASLLDPYTRPDLAFIEPGLAYDKNKTQDWQLRVKLDNGYETTITYNEMHRPLQGWNSKGQVENVEGITNVAIFNKPTDPGEIPTLGKIFLSRSYLRVNYETGMFGLAPSNPSSNPPSELIAIKTQTCACQEDPDAEGCGGGGSGGKPTPVGAIAGGVVGGVAFAILLVAFLVYWGKRKRKRAKNPEMAIVPPSRRHSRDPEVDWTGGRSQRRSTQATNGRLISPRTSGQVADGSGTSANGNNEGYDLRQMSTASAGGVPNSPDEVFQPGELPGDGRWPVPPGRETA